MKAEQTEQCSQIGPDGFHHNPRLCGDHVDGPGYERVGVDPDCEEFFGEYCCRECGEVIDFQ